MIERRRNHFEAIRPWAWGCIVLWAIVAVVGYRTYRGAQDIMQPTINAISQVADRVNR